MEELTEQVYGAFDLHSTNNHLAISDHEDKRLYKKKLPTYPDIILAELDPFCQRLAGIVMESTYNWYWLVDLLMNEGYRVQLANPAGIQKYNGLKYSDDNHDAFWLARFFFPTCVFLENQCSQVRDVLFQLYDVLDFSKMVTGRQVHSYINNVQ